MNEVEPLTAKDLKPCPFCGGEAMPSHSTAKNDEARFSFRCRCCAAVGGWGKSEGSAASYWNMRAGERMKLWRLVDGGASYGERYAIVVCAENEADARKIAMAHALGEVDKWRELEPDEKYIWFHPRVSIHELKVTGKPGVLYDEWNGD